MYPYDFTRENFSPLGYLCEGVTTYQGDLFLLKSRVFNENEFFVEFSDQFQKHFDNPGRLNYSVRSSSIDTWLDGYEPGAPGRKVSIYTEGCLLAFITDVFIMRNTNNSFNLDNVMQLLYQEYALQQKGVSETDYLNAIERISGASFQDYYQKYFVEPGDLTEELNAALDYVGCVLTRKDAPSISESKYGIKYAEPINAAAIKAIYPGSPADLSGLMLEDEIFAVNRIALTKSFDKWITHFQGSPITLLVRRNGLFLDIELKQPSTKYYTRFKVVRVEDPSPAQKAAYAKWIA
jgi:predicted metalloprotease with PDZ domain